MSRTSLEMLTELNRLRAENDALRAASTARPFERGKLLAALSEALANPESDCSQSDSGAMAVAPQYRIPSVPVAPVHFSVKSNAAYNARDIVAVSAVEAAMIYCREVIFGDATQSMPFSVNERPNGLSDGRITYSIRVGDQWSSTAIYVAEGVIVLE